MATLAVVPSLPVHQIAPGQALLTEKFVEGMAHYASLWDGPVIAVMHSEAGQSSGNLDDAVFDTDKLPFELRCTSFVDSSLYAELEDADVVMLGADHHLNDLTDWCSRRGKKTVFVTELSLKTRLQILDSEVSNLLIRWRRYVWAWRQEKRNRRNVSAANAVQCNGTPTYDAYRDLNSNVLLYLDSRITPDMLADQQDIDTRVARLLDGAPLRLAYSGRLLPIKGTDDLIDVAVQLRQLDIPFSLDIYGDGELRPVMARQISDAGLENQITLHGAVDYATELLPAIRSSADLFVCCHRQGDPSCTYLETFACGVPIAGYANEALQGLTRDHPVGWTSPLNSPDLLAKTIAGLHNERQQLADAARHALELAREHTFDAEFNARVEQMRQLLTS